MFFFKESLKTTSSNIGAINTVPTKEKKKFEWQDEYFAVSVSESTLESVRKYIANQEAHHRTKRRGSRGERGRAPHARGHQRP